MSTAIDRPRSPMEEFQDNLKKSLRDDIARMIPEEVIQDMIKRVIEEEFFTRRQKQNPAHTSWNNEPRTIEVSSPFQALVIEAAKPIMERHAAALIGKLEQKIGDQVREMVERGAEHVVLGAVARIIDGAFHDAQQRTAQGIVDLLKRNGLQINPY